MILDTGVMLFLCAFFYGSYLDGNILLWFQTLSIIFVYILCFYAFRAFHFAAHKKWGAMLTAILAGWLAGAVVSTFVLMIFRARLSRPFVIHMTLAFLLCSLLIHSLFFFILSIFIEEERVIVIGNEEVFVKIMEQISSAARGKIKAVKYLAPDENSICKQLKDHPDVNKVIIADRGKITNPDVNSLLAGLIDKKIIVRYLPDVAERTLFRIPLDLAEKYRRFYDIFFIAVEPEAYQRSFDIFLSLCFLLVLSPLWIALAVLILLDSGLPVIFRQERVGLFEKPFTLYKFRTMKHAPDGSGPAFLEQDGEKRITRLGRVLRKTRLDEIPQLVNVLKGDMSIVGPRPEMKEFYDTAKKNIPFYRYRTRIRPGITGWAQVNYRYTTDLESYKRKTEYDLYYVKNRSILLDFQIMLLTAETMLGMKGAK